MSFRAISAPMALIGALLCFVNPASAEAETPQFSPAGPLSRPAMDDTAHREYENKVQGLLNDWSGRLVKLKADAKEEKFLSVRRRRLDRAARHIESDLRVVRGRFADLHTAKEKDWEARRAYIDNEFRDMKKTYDEVLAE